MIIVLRPTGMRGVSTPIDIDDEVSMVWQSFLPLPALLGPRSLATLDMLLLCDAKHAGFWAMISSMIKRVGGLRVDLE